MPMERPGSWNAIRRTPTVQILVGLVLLSGAAATYTTAGIGMQMSAIDMTFMEGMSQAMVPSSDRMTGTEIDARASRSFAEVGLVFLMWWIMMIAMMLPSASPTILTYAALLRHGDDAKASTSIVAFVSGYLFAWAGFSVAATAGHLALQHYGVLGATMALEDGIAVSVVLLATGAYQLLPVKERCLSRCRSPLEFISMHHHDGAFGAVRMGLVHGTYCLGCCAGLMSLLFVGGVMNLFWIAGLAAIVAIEKLSGPGRFAARITGTALVGLGVLGLLPT